jgi:hypothetical protein
MGDGVLVEFRSVVDALKCAVALQQGAVSAGDQVFCLGGRVTNKRYRKRRTLLAGSSLYALVDHDTAGDPCTSAAELFRAVRIIIAACMDHNGAAF